MGRAPCCEKVGLKRGRWTAEEDEILINYIKQHGEGSWRSLPKNAGLLRCGKSCRLRWINYLRPDLKRGNFTREEEETIIKWHKSVGNKWSFIASKLSGRTDNEVKNYWNSHLSRKIYSFRSSTGSMVTTLDMVKMASTCKRKGGRVSRAVAKKYNTNPISKTTTSTTSSSSTKLKIGEISGIKEATTAGNAGVGLSKTRSEMPESRTAENAQTGLGTVEEWGKYHLKPADIYDHVEKGSINSIHEYMCDGLERCPAISMPSPEKLEEENDVLGPNNAPDDVTLLVEKFLESELMDLSEISVDSGMRLNESMDPESGLINKESDCGGTGSKLNSDTADLYQCFSPLNSGFSHELITWDTEYAIPGFELWDQGDDTLWPQ